MKGTDYPVRIHCPIVDAEEIVYFLPKENSGKWTVRKDSFNGCDHNYHSCKECDDCKNAAYEIMKNQIM